MKIQPERTNTGSTIMCALCTILIISLIGANVLLNCTTRYNISSKQVKGWKEALYAAEGGADIAFSEVRKCIPPSDPSTVFLADGWTKTSGPSSFLSEYGNGSYNFGQRIGQNYSLSAKVVTVDQGTFNVPSGPPQYYYRIRSQGTATLLGLPRVGMDDRMDSVTKGDSLLRKIDFQYDHFKAAYGDGDGHNKAITPVPVDQNHHPIPQITRRIETIAVPQLALFTGGLEVGNSFAGPGHAGQIDSYNSKNYYLHPGYVYNPADATNPASAYYADSRNANVSVGTASFTDWGPIYANVSTNGGNVTT